LEEALKALEEKKKTSQPQQAKKSSVNAIRRRTLTNLQRMYALQSNYSKQTTSTPKKEEDDLDEIPEDVLKALLDNTGL
jgi:FKBP-type peptidyl-prolyl cis-trans isomerase (trigger factor)